MEKNTCNCMYVDNFNAVKKYRSTHRSFSTIYQNKGKFIKKDLSAQEQRAKLNDYAYS